MPIGQVEQDFSGHVAVVTGGSGGIGGGITGALAERGASVAVLDLYGQPDAAVFLNCDVRDSGQVSEAVCVVAEELGSISLLVCAAGVVSESPLVDMEAKEWRRVVDVSLSGTFHALRAVLPGMVQRQAGSVVALSSGWASKGYPNGAHYAAAKAGVEAAIKSAALEVAGLGVRANAVALGPIDTPMLTGLSDYAERTLDRTAHIPLGRVGQTDDVIDPVLFLLGEGAKYITGQVLHVNGGLLMP